MRAVVIARPGGPEVLEVRDVPTPEPGADEARVRVCACAVNRADLLQRMGAYPPPHGAPPDIPGLEIAGVVDAVGANVVDVRPGDRVFGIVSGGAYAEAVVVHARTLAPIPEGLDFEAAAAIPEAFLTAYDAVVLQAGLSAGEILLIHAVGSGVGTAAVQIARAIGARPIGTSRSAGKLERAAALGLAGSLVPRAADGAPVFADRVKELTAGEGADVVLELVGGPYVPESLAALRPRGRLVLVGLVAGRRADVDLSLVLKKRLRVMGTALRTRPLEEKIEAGQVLAKNLAPLFAEGKLRPVVDRVMPLERAGDAHAYMAQNEGFGKIVLRVSSA